ncbi:hypothetical protein pb186bvf_002498 [Paramecium bursaria]
MNALDLYVILDINHRFLCSIEKQLPDILQQIKSAVGLSCTLNFSNHLRIYVADNYDCYELLNTSGEDMTFKQSYQRFIEQLYQLIQQKGADDTWEPKFIKAISLSICTSNKRKLTLNKNLETRILLFNSDYLQLSKKSYSNFLSLCAFSEKKQIRIDLIYIRLNQQLVNETKSDWIGIEGLKQGITLAQGIVHVISLEQIQNYFMAQVLLSAFNPGEIADYYQPKIVNQLKVSRQEAARQQDLNQIFAFCDCCNKTTKSMAFCCSRCLGIHCDNTHKQCQKCGVIFNKIIE